MEGVDLFSLPIDRSLNVLYYLLVRDLDEDKRTRLVSQLEMPMKGETPDDGVWSAESMGSAFEQALATTSAQQSGQIEAPGEAEPAEPPP